MATNVKDGGWFRLMAKYLLSRSGIVYRYRKMTVVRKATISALRHAKNQKIFGLVGKKDGWGTWTRTRTSGVRVRGSTINLFPSRGMFGVIF